MKLTRVWCLVVVALAVAFPAKNARADNIYLEGSGGLVLTTGDVNDMLLGGGVGFGGRLEVGVASQFTLFGGGRFAFLSGQDELGVSLTDNGALFSLEVGGCVSLLDRKSSSVSPYLAAAIGIGGLSWSYSNALASVFGSDSDNIGYWFAAPEAGLDFGLGENLWIRVGGRYSVSFYDDKTDDGFLWDLDGGDFVEFYGSILVEL